MADNLVATGIELDTRLMVRAIEQAERRLNALEQQVDRTGKTAKGAERDFLKFAAGAAAAFGAFSAARSATRFIFETNVQFQQLGARLESITGSARGAEAAFNLITQFAVETPFAVQGLTSAFTTLQAVGIEPTKDMLRDLGNFASAMGGNIEDFISAIAKSAMGETTQLRERFFQVIRSEGDQMFVTFRGVEYQMDRTFQGVVDGFRRISQANFAGAMDKQMKTLAGSISNLEDAAALAAKEVGEQGLNAAINDLTQELTDAIQKNDEFARSLGENLAAGVRVSGEAIMLMLEHVDEIVAAMKVLVAVGAGAAMATVVARVIALGNAFLATGGAAALMGASLTALGGPFGILLGVLTASAAAVLLFGQDAKDAAPNLRSFRTEIEEINKALADLTETEARAHASRIAEHMQQIGAAAAANMRRIKELEAERTPKVEFGRGGLAKLQVPAKSTEMTQEERDLRAANAMYAEQITLLQGVFVASHQRAGDAAAEGAARQGAAAAKLAEEFQKLMQGLEEQRLELEQGKRAAFDYKMELDGFSPAQRKAALEVWDAIQALDAKKKADEEAAKATERSRESVERTIEALYQQNIELTKGEEALLRYTLAQQGAQKSDIDRAISLHRQNEIQRKRNEAEENARRKREDEARARLQSETDQLAQSADRMAGEVTDAFESWVTGSEKALKAVSDMVSGVLLEMTRLAIQRSITEPLFAMFTDLLGSAFGSSLPSAAPVPKVAPVPSVGTPHIGPITRVTGRAMGGPIDMGRPYIVGERGPELVVPRSSGTVIPNGAGGVVLHQVVNFNIQALDAPAVDDLLRSRKATIAGVVADAARESTGFRAALTRG